ncbi:hypothetical protein GQ457_11G011590 [Hibiscus cannabinus]
MQVLWRITYSSTQADMGNLKEWAPPPLFSPATNNGRYAFWETLFPPQISHCNQSQFKPSSFVPTFYHFN